MQGVIEYNISSLRGPIAVAFVLLINSLFENVKLIGRIDQYPADSYNKILETEDPVFDFIIVGGGAAGCSLAHRLTEIDSWTVLLLEVGSYPSSATEVPGFYDALKNSHEILHYDIERERRCCLARNNKQCAITRGKLLGGTSSINNMIYARGLLENYDNWGYSAWKSSIVMDVFDKLEKNESGSIIQLTEFNYNDTIKRMLYDLYSTFGYTRKKYGGVTDHYVLAKDGQRMNMAEIFLSPLKSKKNFFLSLNSEGIKVNTASDRKAISIDVRMKGALKKIKVRKEIILTAGPVENAKILLLSGMGDKSYLEEKNITMVSDMKGVGMNLKFHLGLPLFVSMSSCVKENPDDICEEDLYDEEGHLIDIYNYIMHRSGNLSSIHLLDFVTYINSVHVGMTSPNNAIYHTFFKIKDITLEEKLVNMGVNAAIKRAVLRTNENKAILLFTIGLLQPKSSGQVFLNNTWHEGLPRIKGNIFTDEMNEDFKSLYYAFNYVTSLTESEIMKQRNAEFMDIDVPNCRNYKFCSIYYVKCYIYNMAYVRRNIAGTTKMGHLNNFHAVVDMKLRVLRVKNLRVGDSSVMPTITFENTVASDAMFGYRLGEILKGDWLNYISEFTINDTEVH